MTSKAQRARDMWNGPWEGGPSIALVARLIGVRPVEVRRALERTASGRRGTGKKLCPHCLKPVSSRVLVNASEVKP